MSLLYMRKITVYGKGHFKVKFTLKKTDHEFEVNMVKLTVQGLMGAATYRH